MSDRNNVKSLRIYRRGCFPCGRA